MGCFSRVKTKHNQTIGKWGEQVAAEYLSSKGYSVLSRNVYLTAGEIDIVALQAAEEKPCLVFIEVKTRTSLDHGYPEEAFSKTKYQHLLNSIEEYLEKSPGLLGEWRIDVIAVVGSPGEKDPQIRHFEGYVIADERE